MKVKEMIKLLEKMNPDAELEVEYSGYYEALLEVIEPYVESDGSVIIASVEASP